MAIMPFKPAVSDVAKSDIHQTSSPPDDSRLPWRWLILLSIMIFGVAMVLRPHPYPVSDSSDANKHKMESEKKISIDAGDNDKVNTDSAHERFSNHDILRSGDEILSETKIRNVAIEEHSKAGRTKVANKENNCDTRLTQSTGEDHNMTGLAQSTGRDHQKTELTQSTGKDHHRTGLAQSAGKDHHRTGLTQSTEKDHHMTGLTQSTGKDHHNTGLTQSTGKDHCEAEIKTSTDENSFETIFTKSTKERHAKAEATEEYEKINITNANDFLIRHKLYEANELYNKGSYCKAHLKYEGILRHHANSPRALLGLGDCLDKMAAEKRSNYLLEEAITAYNHILMSSEHVTSDLQKMAGRRLADRQEFRGWGHRSVKTLRKLTDKFHDDVSLLKDLGVSLMKIGSNENARQIFKEILSRDPNSGFAMVHLGFIAKQHDNDPMSAVPLLQGGIDSHQAGTQDGRFFFQLGDAYVRLGQSDKAQQVHQRGAAIGLFPSVDQRSLYNVKSLTARPWWTVEQTGYKEYVEVLQEKWEVIRDEGLGQLDANNSFLLESENLRESGDWKQFTLFQQGQQNRRACSKTPVTCDLINRIPPARTCKRGQVKFSVMQPGVHVWPHCGPTNCRLRAHLGLVVPGGLRIRVANETRTWREGQFLIFDDSYEHEVWHDGPSVRLVLIVDFWHPELTPDQRRMLTPI